MPKQTKNNTRKDGRVQVAVDLGRDPVTGRRKRKYFYGTSTKEALAKAAAFRKDVANGYDALSEGTPLYMWVDKWYTAYKAGVSYGTAQNYKYAMAHIKEALGYKQMRDISQTDVVLFANTFTDYSAKYINHMRTTLNQILRAAVHNGMLIRNPADGVRWPAGSKGTHRALTDWEIQAIKNNWAEHRAGLWMMVMLFAGLRRGEMMALRWDDIDFRKQEINVKSAVHFEGNKPVVGPTKTEAGIRTIPMMEPLQIALEQARFARIGLYVCHGKDGGLITQMTLRRGSESFNKHLSGKEGKEISFRCHDLRHTFATLLYDADVDVKSAQYLLGHTDIKMTMQIYTHISEGRKKTYTDKIRTFKV